MAPAPDALVIRGAIVGGIVALAIGLALARRRRAYSPPTPRMPEDAFPAGARPALTAFYFTSRLCAACQETPGVVRAADASVPVVALWVHERPDLVRALGIYETPTLLLADAEGRIRYARVGNPAPAELAFYVEEARASSSLLATRSSLLANPQGAVQRP